MSSMVEPIHPLERRKLDLFDVPPGAALANDLCLEETEDRLGQSVVIGVSDASNGGLDAGLGQALGVADRQILHTPI